MNTKILCKTDSHIFWGSFEAFYYKYDKHIYLKKKYLTLITAKKLVFQRVS